VNKLRLKTTLVSITIAFSFLVGCDWESEEILISSTGNAGDLIVVMDSSMWAGNIGLQVRKCFSAPQEGLPKSEPVFNVIEVYPSSFNRIFKTTRNIVLIEKDLSNEASTYVLKENLWAKNQLVLVVKAGRNKDAAEIIAKNCEGIMGRFREEEWRRLQFAFARLSDKAVMKKVKDLTGVNLVIPNDYVFAHEEENFVWLRKDFDSQGHQISMGLMIYNTPYDSLAVLDAENIIAERNKRTKVVDGPVKGSHMSTYEEYAPAEREFGFNDKYVKELRGLWNMKGAFMGGPFIHYSFIDETGKNQVNIDGYVFAPKFDKREYLRELEAIALSGVK